MRSPPVCVNKRIFFTTPEKLDDLLVFTGALG
jgi:hypothetical protein